MGLFSKKDCSICGSQSGVLSNRKLADGNLCKDCRSKLSPFYNVTNKDTVAGIQAQLDYRERNRAALASFHPDAVVGERLFIDRQSGKFALCMEHELEEENPDLFDLSAVRGCELDVEEHRNRGGENEHDSYDYEFFLLLTLDHPFVRNIRYHYNGYTVFSWKRIRTEEIRKIYLGQKEMKSGLAAFVSGKDKRAMEAYLQEYARGEDMINAIMNPAALGADRSWGQPAPMVQQPAYQQPVVPAAPVSQPVSRAAAAPSRAAFCTNCGSPVTGGAFCTNCGAKL